MANQPPLQQISHRRFNPLTGSWLLISPHRTQRPWQGQQESVPTAQLEAYDAKCYLCPGNTRAQGDSNPKYENTFVFINDYSAVRESQSDPAAPSTPSSSDDHDLAPRLLRAEPVTGKCYVMTFSPKHNVTLADMAVREITTVVDTWTRIYASHLAPVNPLGWAAERVLAAIPQSLGDATAPPKTRLRYMQIFENKGAAMGCSNPHPHCQIWTTSSMPEEPAKELARMVSYRAENSGRHLLADYVRLEIAQADRVVWQNEAFVVVCPWWAVWPFEVLVIPKRHVRALVDLTEQEHVQFAEALHQVTTRYDNLFYTSFPYSSGIHQAPLDCSEEEAESSYLHMHFYPPLLRSAKVRKFLVGYEMLAEPQRDITPEQAAARLRDCGGSVYRKAPGIINS